MIPMASLGVRITHFQGDWKHSGQLGSFKLLSNLGGHCTLLVTIAITGQSLCVFHRLWKRQSLNAREKHRLWRWIRSAMMQTPYRGLHCVLDIYFYLPFPCTYNVMTSLFLLPRVAISTLDNIFLTYPLVIMDTLVISPCSLNKSASFKEKCQTLVSHRQETSDLLVNSLRFHSSRGDEIEVIYKCWQKSHLWGYHWVSQPLEECGPAAELFRGTVHQKSLLKHTLK